MASKMDLNQFIVDEESEILDLIEEHLRSEVWLSEWSKVMNELKNLLKPLELEAAEGRARKARKQREPKVSSKKETFNYARRSFSLNGNGGETVKYSQGQGAGKINKQTDHNDDIGDDIDMHVEANSGVEYLISNIRSDIEVEVCGNFTKDSQPKNLEPLATPKFGTVDGKGGGRIPLSVGWVVDDIYYIDKVVDARLGRPLIRGETRIADLVDVEYKVKWTGWPDNFNSWVKKTDIHDQSSVMEFWGAKMQKARKLNSKSETTSQSTNSSGSKGNVGGVYCL